MEVNQVRAKDLKQFEKIFDHLPDGIISVSAAPPRTISNINAIACDILDARKQEVLGQRIESVFTANYSPLLQVIDETFEQEREIKNFSIELATRDNESKAFLINTVFLDVGKRKSERGVILILHDISEVSQLRQRSVTKQPFETLIGSTPAMKKVFSLIDTVAPTNAAVLINGETGTGKELVARAIHERSGRANGPFVPVHCSAITSSLLESDLFGHTKGAFTGAIRDKPGRFEMAEGGTIFLDEIATLSPEIQVSLLRVLQEKTIEPVGGTKSITVDVRIISATNRRLPALIQQNVFRKDLYYRVNVLQISLPPLRKRIKDIPALTSHFIEKYNRQHGCNIVGISREANKILTSYSWPGNVRELENAIEHAVILGQHNLIEPWHLPEEIREVEKNKLSFPSTGTFPISEEDKIRNALAKTAGNVTRAAHILGIHRTTLWRKMRELKIPRLPEML